MKTPPTTQEEDRGHKQARITSNSSRPTIQQIASGLATSTNSRPPTVQPRLTAPSQHSVNTYSSFTSSSSVGGSKPHYSSHHSHTRIERISSATSSTSSITVASSSYRHHASSSPLKSSLKKTNTNLSSQTSSSATYASSSTSPNQLPLPLPSKTKVPTVKSLFAALQIHGQLRSPSGNGNNKGKQPSADDASLMSDSSRARRVRFSDNDDDGDGPDDRSSASPNSTSKKMMNVNISRVVSAPAAVGERGPVVGSGDEVKMSSSGPIAPGVKLRKALTTKIFHRVSKKSETWTHSFAYTL